MTDPYTPKTSAALCLVVRRDDGHRDPAAVPDRVAVLARPGPQLIVTDLRKPFVRSASAAGSAPAATSRPRSLASASSAATTFRRGSHRGRRGGFVRRRNRQGHCVQRPDDADDVLERLGGVDADPQGASSGLVPSSSGHLSAHQHGRLCRGFANLLEGPTTASGVDPALRPLREAHEVRCHQPRIRIVNWHRSLSAAAPSRGRPR